MMGGGVANNLQNTGPHFSTLLPSNCVVFFPSFPSSKSRETIKSREHFPLKPIKAVFTLNMYRLDLLFKHTANPRGSENRDAFYTRANGDAEFGKSATCVNILSNALLKQLNLFSINTCYGVTASQRLSRGLRLRRKYIWTLQRKHI